MRSAPLASLALLSLAALGCAGPPLAAPDAAPPPDGGFAQDAAARLDAPLDCSPIMLDPAGGDLLWLVDTTGSWTSYPDRYAGATDAVVEAARAWSLGDEALATFPRFDDGAPPVLACGVAVHERVDLDWGVTDTAMREALVSRTFDGASSLGPALEGAIRVARARAAETRWRTTSLILVTDASPSTDEACDTTWDELAAIAARGFDDGRAGGVRTHVLSVIGRAVSDQHFGRIDALADAGGGRAAVVNGARADVAASAGSVLTDIHERTSICTRILPDGLVPESITVTFPDGSFRAAQRVADAGDCGSVSAGFYVDDPADPTVLTLCSGHAGIGGICEAVFVQARTLGAPTVAVDGSCAR